MVTSTYIDGSNDVIVVSANSRKRHGGEHSGSAIATANVVILHAKRAGRAGIFTIIIDGRLDQEEKRAAAAPTAGSPALSRDVLLRQTESTTLSVLRYDG